MRTKIITAQEVSEHSTKEEPYIVIHDRVYSLKHLLAEHPGGEKILLQHAGEDATAAFEEQRHSEDARKWMKDFEIGLLAGSKTALDALPKWYEKTGIKVGGVFLGLAAVVGTVAIVVHQIHKN